MTDAIPILDQMQLKNRKSCIVIFHDIKTREWTGVCPTLVFCIQRDYRISWILLISLSMTRE